MPIVAAALVIGCIALTLVIARGRRGRVERPELDPEIGEALERMRASLRRPRVVVAGAALVALLLIAALARNPGRWALMLLALAVLGAATTAYVLRSRARERGRD
jgi:hypothetical protein